MRVWVDFTNTAHVVVLRPLVERLQHAGHDVLLTARPLSHTVELLEQWGAGHTVVGRYGGVSRAGKARAAADRARRLTSVVRRFGPDKALAHGSTDVPLVGRLLRIPNTTTFDYEWAALQHHLNCRLATRVLVPAAIPAERMARYGARPPKLVQYAGLKEEYYLSDFEPDRGLLEELGVATAEILAVVRTAPSYALYLGGSETPLLGRVLRRLTADRRTHTVVLPRTPEQAGDIAALDLDRVVVPPRTVDGRSLVALADLLVSAGGTMNREAAALGVPVYTTFAGQIGAVDEQLLAEGRLRALTSADAIELRKRGPAHARVERDPARFLDLLLTALER